MWGRRVCVGQKHAGAGACFTARARRRLGRTLAPVGWNSSDTADMETAISEENQPVTMGLRPICFLLWLSLCIENNGGVENFLKNK